MELINLIKIFAHRFRDLLSYKNILTIMKLNKNFKYLILEDELFKYYITPQFKCNYYISNIAPHININFDKTIDGFSYDRNHSVYDNIAINGDIYILDLIFKNMHLCVWDFRSDILKYVMKTELLEYLINVGFKFNIKIRRFLCENSALNGNFKILKWLVDNEYGLNGKVCYYAKIVGHYEIENWAHQQGRHLFDIKNDDKNQYNIFIDFYKFIDNFKWLLLLFFMILLVVIDAEYFCFLMNIIIIYFTLLYLLKNKIYI